jgi:hypothetical protein
MRHTSITIIAICLAFSPSGRMAFGQPTPRADLQWETVFGTSWPLDSLGHLGSLFTTRLEPSAPIDVARLIENAHVRISEDMLDDLSRRDLDQRMSVEEEMLGVPLTGHSRLTGDAHVELAENPDRGVFDILLTGTIVSHTRGDAGRAQIHTRTVTKFAARKRILLDETGLRALPARCNARSHATLLGTSSSLPGLRGRLARRISRSRAQESLPECERIAARRAADRLCRQFDHEAGLQVAAANELLREPLRLLAAQPGLQTPLRFFTTKEHLCVAGAQWETERLGLPERLQHLEQDVAALAVVPAGSFDLTAAAALLGMLTSGESKRSLPQLARQALPPELTRALAERKLLERADYKLRLSVNDGNYMLLLLNGADEATYERPEPRLTRNGETAVHSVQSR